MIPKIIHQTWKDEEIPPKWKVFVENNKALNADWEYMLWTDDKCLKFVEQEFPDFLKQYQSFPKNIMRADVIRYLIMYKIGGVYLDLDYELLKPFQFGNHQLVLPYNRQKSYGDTYDGVGNCFFASVPKHKFWLEVINDLKQIKSIESPSFFLDSTMEEETTGPAFLTRVLNKGRYPDIYKPDRLVYHPPVPKNRKQESRIKNNGISLGIHHCWGSWRDRSVKKLVQILCRRTFKLLST